MKKKTAKKTKVKVGDLIRITFPKPPRPFWAEVCEVQRGWIHWRGKNGGGFIALNKDTPPLKIKSHRR